MLKNLKKGGKKDTKKQSKTKKEEKKTDELAEGEEETTQLVDIDYNQKESEKVKRQNKKKNESKLEEKEIDIDKIQIEKKVEEVKPRTTWVANSVQEVIKTDFKIEEHDHEFDSLTDEKFNQEQKQKKKKFAQQQKGKPTEKNGFMFAPLEKTKTDELMEKADNSQANFVKKNTNTIGSISLPTQQKTFINSNINQNHVPLEKTPQQIRMEQLEKEQEEKALNAPPPAKQTWLGRNTKKQEKPEQKIQFKKTFNFTNSAGTGNLNVMPLEKSNQEKLMEKRQEQEFRFKTKKEIEEGKKKREENIVKDKPTQ